MQAQGGGRREEELALSTHWHPYAAYVLPTPETSRGERGGRRRRSCRSCRHSILYKFATLSPKTGEESWQLSQLLQWTHTVDAAKLGRLLFLLLFGQLLLGSSIFYASKSNNLRISYGHTYFTCCPPPTLSPSLSLSSSLASCVMNFPRLPLPNWATGHGSLGYQLSAKAETATGAEAEPKLKPVRLQPAAQG